MKAFIKLGISLGAVTFLNLSCSSTNEAALKNSEAVPSPAAEACATPPGST